MSLHPCVNHVTLDNTGRPYGLDAADKGVSDAAVRADIKSAPTDTLAAFS